MLWMLALICSLPVTNRAQVEKTEPENSKFPMTQSPTYNLEKAEKLARAEGQGDTGQSGARSHCPHTP